MRVLLVDDEASLRRVMRRVLERRGLDVVGEAADGQEAVDKCRELNPDVVVLDVRMPSMDGLTALRAIKALSPSPRVVMDSAYEDETFKRDAAAAGAAAFLVKGALVSSAVEIITGKGPNGAT
jgi:two-component system chemotaxis response regulator CheY